MTPQTDLSMVALAHLSMIAQAANGEYKPQPGEIERRQSWLTEYLTTGQGIVTDDAKLSAQLSALHWGKTQQTSQNSHSIKSRATDARLSNSANSGLESAGRIATPSNRQRESDRDA